MDRRTRSGTIVSRSIGRGIPLLLSPWSVSNNTRSVVGFSKCVWMSELGVSLTTPPPRWSLGKMTLLTPSLDHGCGMVDCWSCTVSVLIWVTQTKGLYRKIGLWDDNFKQKYISLPSRHLLKFVPQLYPSSEKFLVWLTTDLPLNPIPSSPTQTLLQKRPQDHSLPPLSLVSPPSPHPF